jgi:hypothetical protein
MKSFVVDLKAFTLTEKFLETVLSFM